MNEYREILAVLEADDVAAVRLSWYRGLWFARIVRCPILADWFGFTVAMDGWSDGESVTGETPDQALRNLDNTLRARKEAGDAQAGR
jgi:hypothetical protein